VCIALIPLCAAVVSPARGDENDLLDYCLDHPRQCALSVEAIDEGWQRHWNADRPQVLASTFKTLVLIAYAQAVADGDLSADGTVTKEEWARYFVGGSTLAQSWGDLGSPERVRLDDLARVMILNSDNQAPDLFLASLIKKTKVKKATRLFDWHDFPVPISSMFTLWSNLDDVGGTGNRVATDYGGFEAAGYQKELKPIPKKFRKNSFVETVRENLCAQPPWFTGTPPCSPAGPFTTEGNLRTLENHHFTRGTTRAYATLLRGLLDRTLLSPAAQEVVERNFDQAWLDLFPSLTGAFSRYGLKGGNLATGAGNQVMTWAHYMETAGGRYVVIVFLQDMLSTNNVPGAGDVNAFAQQFALNATFRQAVRGAFEDEPLPPELVPRLMKVQLGGSRTVTVRAKAENSSPVPTGGFEIALYLLDDAEVGAATPVATKTVGPLRAYRSKSVTLGYTADQDVSGKLAVVVVDSNAAVEEQDEANNITWERLN
jgi:hypothetical protein